MHEANIQDRDGAKLVIERLKGRFARLTLIWADGGYAGKLIEWVKDFASWTLEIVKRNDDLKGFKVIEGVGHGGVFQWGGEPGLPRPAAPSVTPQGRAGTTRWGIPDHGPNGRRQ